MFRLKVCALGFPICIRYMYSNYAFVYLKDISDTLEKFGSQKTSLGIDDRFQDVMGVSFTNM